jgi:hypothetical protein
MFHGLGRIIKQKKRDFHEKITLAVKVTAGEK